jgi:hypothetical protein
VSLTGLVETEVAVPDTALVREANSLVRERTSDVNFVDMILDYEWPE